MGVGQLALSGSAPGRRIRPTFDVVDRGVEDIHVVGDLERQPQPRRREVGEPHLGGPVRVVSSSWSQPRTAAQVSGPAATSRWGGHIERSGPLGPPPARRLARREHVVADPDADLGRQSGGGEHAVGQVVDVVEAAVGALHPGGARAAGHAGVPSLSGSGQLAESAEVLYGSSMLHEP